MKHDSETIVSIVSDEENNRSKTFWRKAFTIYAMVEMTIMLIHYVTTRSKCNYCVLPPAFYILILLQHLIFTGLLWYCLNSFYHLHGWRIVVLNILLFAAHYFLWILMLYAIFHSGQSWLIWKPKFLKSFSSLFGDSWIDIAKYVLKLSAFYVLKFYVEFRKAERQRIQLAVVNKDMQLNLLKQQLSPHFYFNTLNNLYGLARSNSAKLSNALSQLSNIMQYVIVECNQPKVLLSQEIIFLQSYIELEKLRYEQHTVIAATIQGDAGDLTILPLLLIQFVENAFKHGMKEKSDQNWMKVNITIQKNELLFRVENSNYKNLATAGLGINSVKHILNLQYEGKYTMQMQHEYNRFLVSLKLNLS